MLGSDVAIRDLQWAYRAGTVTQPIYRSIATIGATTTHPTDSRGRDPLLHSNVRPVAIDDRGKYKTDRGYTATANATQVVRRS